MSDVEFFGAGNAAESYDPAAFERFKEQMKKNGAFAAAAQRQEQRQKEKEDRLAKILQKFIQSNQKSGLLMLAARLLKENIPPSFILSIILLGNEEVLAELKREASEELKALKAGETPASPQSNGTTDFSLVTRFGGTAFPLKAKAEIDEWGRMMHEAASAVPFRILETVLDKTGMVKNVVIDCMANVLGDFLKDQELPSMGYDTYFSFCEFLVHRIVEQLKKQIENQKELK